MAIFGEKTKANPWADLVYDLARKAEAEALLKNRQQMLDAEQEHKDDCSSYVFSAKRHGDFLAVFITRGKDKYVGALNLKQSPEIKFELGNIPDLNGRLIFNVMWEKDGEHSNVVSYGIAAMDCSKEPPKDYHYQVRATFLSRPWRSMIYVAPPPQNNAMGYQGSWFGVDHGNMMNAPQPVGIARWATDDKIVFSGIQTTLFVPAGKGNEIYEKILSSIADGEDANFSKAGSEGR